MASSEFAYLSRALIALSSLLLISSAHAEISGCPSDPALTGYNPEAYKKYVLGQIALEQLEPRFAREMEARSAERIDTIEELIEIRTVRITNQLMLVNGFAKKFPNEYRCHRALLEQQRLQLTDQYQRLKENELVPGRMLPWSEYESRWFFRIE